MLRQKSTYIMCGLIYYLQRPVKRMEEELANPSKRMSTAKILNQDDTRNEAATEKRKKSTEEEKRIY